MGEVDDNSALAREDGRGMGTEGRVDGAEITHHEAEIVGGICFLDVGGARGGTLSANFDSCEGDGCWGFFLAWGECCGCRGG